MTLDLVPLWACILSLAVLMYVLLDGFDLGVGMLFFFRRHDEDRDLMVASVAPIWDFNETWLVLGSGGLLAVFPLAFSIIMPAVYFPILLMLLGLLFRGVAFEFRDVPRARKHVWNTAFAWGSLIATFSQGVVLGNFIRGFPVNGRIYAGTSWDWIAPFPLLTGVGLIVGYCLLGATWLVMKTEGDLQEWARRMARWLLLGLLAFILMVSVWTPLEEPRIAERWFSFPNLLYFAPVPILTLVIAATLWHALSTKRDMLPFLCAMGLFFLSYTGLIISLWPYVAPPSITLWDAATAPMSQQFLMVGTMFLLPVILLYVFWSYWVFRGKVRGDIGYH
ncbi:cytochrome bd-I ubiquinol oxidase subunit 2 apoprotein [Paucimonas lemoignei]|uniref:Cytochrome bd-I ubiquinol oxidase subunit 2 apoprotein n=1 Tax=Paucimonas lemoignei TaxID=29443 RepID=A0A4R3HNU8_PAULE|nr:cytochrome d ubiquinol oxidase subunit II [Paucimonas lemoignei]TCS32603.1 cytochrome bd-I ubiquinol oxidase subunit 2 apoprotein [Paucimonas lemoignei]